MKTIGQLPYRIVSILLLVLVAVVPLTTASAAAMIASDDFNRCAVGPNWTFGPTGTNLPAPAISGEYSGSSAYVSLTVPPGQDLTFDKTKQDAPRLMTPTSSTQDWDLEVAFLSPLGAPPAGAWFIQGVLVRDTTSVPGKSRWLRFDFNTNSSNDVVNYYIAYIDENGVQTDIQKVTPIGAQATYPRSTAPLDMGIHYQAATSQWSYSFRVGPNDNWHTKTPSPFVNANVKPDQVGFFASATGPNAAALPGFVSKVDYIRDWIQVPNSSSFNNDGIKLTINPSNGNGTVTQACTGTNVVTLTAKPGSGASFLSWSGLDAPSSQNPVNLTMSKSYSVTANFSGGTNPPPVNLGLHIYIPFAGH